MNTRNCRDQGQRHRTDPVPLGRLVALVHASFAGRYRPQSGQREDLNRWQIGKSAPEQVRRGARAAESDSLLTSELWDSGTNLRTRKSPARHDATGSDSVGPENIGPLIGPAVRLLGPMGFTERRVPVGGCPVFWAVPEGTRPCCTLQVVLPSRARFRTHGDQHL